MKMKVIAPLICAKFEVEDKTSFNGQTRSYRVTGYCKEVQKPTFTEDDWIGELLWDAEDRNDEDYMMIVMCSREEAEYVIGYGLAGTIQPLDKITVTGMVDWSAEKIEEENRKYPASLQLPRMSEPFSVKRR